MTIEVLLFAQLREAMNTDRVQVAAALGETVGVVAERVLGDMRNAFPLRFAVNADFVDESHLVREGDQLTILTPVSGG